MVARNGVPIIPLLFSCNHSEVYLQKPFFPLRNLNMEPAKMILKKISSRKPTFFRVSPPVFVHLKLIWAPIIFSKQTTPGNQVTRQIPQICRVAVFSLNCPPFFLLRIQQENPSRNQPLKIFLGNSSRTPQTWIHHDSSTRGWHESIIIKIIPKDCNVLIISNIVKGLYVWEVYLEQLCINFSHANKN